jgi:NADH-quinone oxidoreductase subunit F
MSHGLGRPQDLDLLLDVGDNISPGLNAPFSQTTICPLGPSAVSPIASAVLRFRDEFERYVGGAYDVNVKVSGAAYNSKPELANA